MLYLESGHATLRAGAKQVGVPNGHSYWVPRYHVSADPGIVRYLVSMVDENPEVTINDFGAGVGQYGHELMGARPKAKYLGYDGAGNVEHFTHQPAPARVNLQTMRKTPPWGSRERSFVTGSSSGSTSPSHRPFPRPIG